MNAKPESKNMAIPCARFRELTGRTARILARLQGEGLSPLPTSRRTYELVEIVGCLARCWDKIASLQSELSSRPVLDAEASGLDEKLKAELLRKRVRENSIAEDRLIQREFLVSEILRASQVIRDRSRDMVDDLVLKLSLPDHAANKLKEARRKFLDACASELTGETEY